MKTLRRNLAFDVHDLPLASMTWFTIPAIYARHVPVALPLGVAERSSCLYRDLTLATDTMSRMVGHMCLASS